MNKRLTESVQELAATCGLEVDNMALNELNYATEVAAAMLKKQTAAATVAARQLIVQGAVEIAEDTVRHLEQSGLVKMSDADKVKIVTNVLTVTCSDSDAAPVLPI